MTTLKNFLDRLDLVTFDKRVDSKTLKGGAMGNDVEVRFDTKLMSSPHDIEDMPIQAIMYVFINGHSAAFWGAEGHKDVVAMTKWFISAKNKAQDNEFEMDNNNRDEAALLWKKDFKI